MHSVLPHPTADHPSAAWQAMSRALREAIWTRQRGDAARADQLLRDVVPARVAAWSRSDKRSAAEQRRVLADLVEAEEQRAAEASALADILSERLGVRLADHLAARLESLLSASKATLGPKPEPLRDQILGFAAEQVRVLRGGRAAQLPVPTADRNPSPREERIPLDDIAAMIDRVTARAGEDA